MHRMAPLIPVTLGVLLACGPAASSARSAGGNRPTNPSVSLSPTVRPTALRDAKAGSVAITGRVTAADAARVRVRVTTTRGETRTATAAVRDGAFSCDYPRDFPGAGALRAGMLFIDATTSGDFNTARAGHFQAEAAVIVYDSRTGKIADLPTAFTNDLLDRQGRTDAKSAEWPVIRSLVNLYMHSRAARVIGIARRDFDLARPGDLAWFQNSLGIYDFDHRDRDWSTPLGHRRARTFWQAVWDTWFNATNNNPIDGNPRNNRPSNFTPYCFANDFSDNLILYVMRQRGTAGVLDDNLQAICREGTANMLAMQHRTADNFALRDRRGRRETYTAGAFRYGMFENGRFMTEGTGWFSNPAFLDYIRGGVFNGRSTWALGEALQHDPHGPLAGRVKRAVALSVAFCLRDALKPGYARRTAAGNVYWQDAGEHAYLLLGMLAACRVAPELRVPLAGEKSPVTLRQACVASLNALCDLEKPHHQWSVYPNKDSVAIMALAEGVRVLGRHPDAPRWRRTARAVADAWLAARVDPKEYPARLVHFGLRIAPDRMTFNWRRLSPKCADANFIHLYLTGHWIDALSRLHAVTGQSRYRRRAEAMIAYLCGDNPWRVRLLNETGGVYNWVEDTDGDGVEDRLKQDMYPESTCFCQIGIMHLMHTLARPPGRASR